MNAYISAEALKLSRQPSVLFWGFFAGPLIGIAIKIILEGLFVLRYGKIVSNGDEDIILSAAQSLAISGNPFVQLLFAIGVTSVFYVEYRYSTLRNLVPRTYRTGIYGSKFAVCLLFFSGSLMLTALGDIAINIAISIASQEGRHGVWVANSTVTLIIAYFLSVLELSVLTALTAAVTILFRSMMPAVVLVFSLGMMSLLLQTYLGGLAADIPLPLMAADSVRAWLTHKADPHVAMIGFSVLTAWFLVLAIAGTLTFSRQELAAE